MRFLLGNTTRAVKVGKNTNDTFRTNVRVPQGDILSPKLFTLYLDAALKEVDKAREGTQDHTFALPRVLLPPHIEYADDADFICKNSDWDRKN